MKALILAAGRGSRMGSATDEKPKCLTTLAGHTLLEMQLNALRGAGIQETALVTGYMHETLEAFGLPTFHNERWSMTNMVGSLQCAEEWLMKDTCIVSYADIFYSSASVQCLSRNSEQLAISYDPEWLRLWSRRFDDPLSDAETFRRDTGGRLIEIGQAAAHVDEIEGQYVGLLKFTPAAWQQVVDVIPDRDTWDTLDMTSLLSRLIANGSNIGTEAILGDWGEVDSQADADVYEAMLAAGEIKLPIN